MKKCASRTPGKSPMLRRFDSKAISLAKSIWESIDSPVANELISSLSRGDHHSIVSLKIDPSQYSCAASFADDYLSASLLSKFPCFDLGLDLEAEALVNFKASEASCSAAGNRLKQVYVNGVLSRITPESILSSARAKIARVLGPFSWDAAESYFDFGLGATYSIPSRRGDPYYKFREKPCVTSDCAILAYTALHRIPAWFNHLVSLTGLTYDEVMELPLEQRVPLLFTIVRGNRVTFVPKDAKKLRTIAIEPTMNGFLQHGIGKLIRKRLQRVPLGPGEKEHIDLRDQSLNQRLAHEGSLHDSLATVDLSAASDSVSLELVRALLPEDWFLAICLTRSSVGVLPSGEEVTYQKVSSMGNGYTFDLESLIFWALSRASVDLLMLGDRRVCIFGDDIIVHKNAWPTLHWILTFCGFQCNKEKSFVEGPFRESCGKHYFRGHDVTPFYVREDINTPSRLIWFANQIRRWSRLSYGLDGRLEGTYRKAVGFLPPSLRQPSIPDGFGDFALFGDLDECAPSYSKKLYCYKASVWLPFNVTWVPDGVPYLLRCLSGASSKYYDDISGISDISRKWKRLSARPSSVSRAGLQKWERKLIPIKSWDSYGPWFSGS